MNSSVSTPAHLLAQGLNTALAQQPMARQRLTRHAGKRITLALPPWPIELELDAEGHFAVPGPETEADALSGTISTLTLTPNPAALPRWLTGGSLNDLFRAEGDGQLAADIAYAVADFDWVLALRPFVGDIAATRFDQAVQGLTAWRTQAAEAFGRNVAEYAVHEAGVLANPEAVCAFVADVDALREATDRLEARLALLETPPAQ